MDYILQFIQSILDIIIMIITYLINAIDGMLDFIISIPEVLETVISSVGGVLTIVIALFSNLPNNLWLGVLIVMFGYWLYWLMWDNARDQS